MRFTGSLAAIANLGKPYSTSDPFPILTPPTSSSMANINRSHSIKTLDKLQRPRNRLHLLRNQGRSHPHQQHHLPHSAARKHFHKSTLRHRPPSHRSQLLGLGRARMGWQHGPQSTHRLVSQRSKTDRIFPLGYVRPLPPFFPSPKPPSTEKSQRKEKKRRDC